MHRQSQQQSLAQNLLQQRRQKKQLRLPFLLHPQNLPRPHAQQRLSLLLRHLVRAQQVRAQVITPMHPRRACLVLAAAVVNVQGYVQVAVAVASKAHKANVPHVLVAVPLVLVVNAKEQNVRVVAPVQTQA